jgi:hypothetical protein
MIRGGVCRQLRRPAKDNTSEPINCFEGDQQPEMRRSGQKTAARAQISLVGLAEAPIQRHQPYSVNPPPVLRQLCRQDGLVILVADPQHNLSVLMRLHFVIHTLISNLR